MRNRKERRKRSRMDLIIIGTEVAIIGWVFLLAPLDIWTALWKSNLAKWKMKKEGRGKG